MLTKAHALFKLPYLSPQHPFLFQNPPRIPYHTQLPCLLRLLLAMSWSEFPCVWWPCSCEEGGCWSGTGIPHWTALRRHCGFLQTRQDPPVARWQLPWLRYSHCWNQTCIISKVFCRLSLYWDLSDVFLVILVWVIMCWGTIEVKCRCHQILSGIFSLQPHLN